MRAKAVARWALGGGIIILLLAAIALGLLVRGRADDGTLERVQARGELRVGLDCWARAFFEWYNHEHRHSGLGLMAPATVHYGQTQTIREQRQQVLQAAYAAHPERFVRGLPIPPKLPTAVWINRPQTVDEAGDGASSISDTDEHLTLELPEWALHLDTKFRLELSHNA